MPEALGGFVVEKGSVTINGVSLTVASLDGLAAEIAIIPQTLAATNLGELAPGQGFNFEVDVLASTWPGCWSNGAISPPKGR